MPDLPMWSILVCWVYTIMWSILVCWVYTIMWSILVCRVYTILHVLQTERGIFILHTYMCDVFLFTCVFVFITCVCVCVCVWIHYAGANANHQGGTGHSRLCRKNWYSFFFFVCTLHWSQNAPSVYIYRAFNPSCALHACMYSVH